MEQRESVADAARSDDRRRALIALRDKLALSIDVCESMRDLSPLSARLADVLAQIEELTPKTQTGDPVDEIAARRASRGAGPAPSAARTAAN